MHPFVSPVRVDSTAIIKQVYLFMAVALALSGLTAYLFGTHDELGQLVYKVVEHKPKFTVFGWVALLSPLGIILLMGSGIERFSSGTMVVLFLLLSVCEGLSLSTVFLTYTKASIALTFFIAAGMFALTSAYGYLTKTDLTKWGNLLFMALLGLLLALVANLFLRSALFDYILSGLGVLLFTGLIAYDTQKLKQLGSGDADSTTKLAVLGALTLYLDFVNIFLFLLRFLGVKKSDD